MNWPETERFEDSSMSISAATAMRWAVVRGGVIISLISSSIIVIVHRHSFRSRSGSFLPLIFHFISVAGFFGTATRTFEIESAVILNFDQNSKNRNQNSNSKIIFKINSQDSRESWLI